MILPAARPRTALVLLALCLASCQVTGMAPTASTHTGMTCKCGTSGP